MILKASQRGNTYQLAAHLLNTADNEHVEIHEIKGFIANDVRGAFQEIDAISQATQCKQFLFSLSLNPPENEHAPIEYFENALADIEKSMNLKGQPRIMIFHEKEGRRHCHTVWSRITPELKAVNMSFFKRKLMDISRRLYIKHGWDMPAGLQNSADKSRKNYDLVQHQQAKRTSKNPQAIKEALQKCWQQSDSKNAFVNALKEQGYTLAKGDKRGFVAVDSNNEIYALSRWLGVKNKELKNRLGNPQDLLSVDEVKQEINAEKAQDLKIYKTQLQHYYDSEKRLLLEKKQALVKYQREIRQRLKTKQEARQQQEHMTRLQRLPKGLKALWAKINGQYKRIEKQNAYEVEQCRQRDLCEWQNMIDAQLAQRQSLQVQIKELKNTYNQQAADLKQDIAFYQAGFTPDM